MTLLGSIADLLRADGDTRTPRWDDLLVQRNSAPLPTPYPGADTMWNRGFDFLLLDGGTPTHYCRCRSAGDARARRASEIRARLSKSPELARLVPPSHFVVADDRLVEITRYIGGRLLNGEIPGLHHDLLARDARKVLAANRLITRQGERIIASLRDPRPVVPLLGEARAALSFVADAGLGEARVEALRGALASAGTVPPRSQHGDLWPANVLRCGDDFVIVDFEVFGEVRVPLFDVFHFLRHCVMQRDRHSRPLLDILQGGGPDATLFGTIVAEESVLDGLSAIQGGGAFVYYLTVMAASIRGRKGPEAYWGPIWRCLERCADRLAEGLPLLRLLETTPR
jgi:hypothetical protein